MTSHELFELQGVKNNYGQPQKPTVQLSHFFNLKKYNVNQSIKISLYQIKTQLIICKVQCAVPIYIYYLYIIHSMIM
jgi:hypothetical protein